MTGVTLRPKRNRESARATPTAGEWLYACLGCGVLDVANRRDKITCSPRCRVRLSRNAEIARLVEQMKIDIATLSHTRAVVILDEQGAQGAAEIAAEVRSGNLEDGARLQDRIVPVFWQWLCNQLEPQP